MNEREDYDDGPSGYDAEKYLVTDVVIVVGVLLLFGLCQLARISKEF